MLSYILIGIVLYLLIGVGLLIYAVTTSNWGGLILHFWYLIILLYPYLIVRSLIEGFRDR